jgi:hypothetical protein
MALGDGAGASCGLDDPCAPPRERQCGETGMTVCPVGFDRDRIRLPGEEIVFAPPPARGSA